MFFAAPLQAGRKPPWAWAGRLAPWGLLLAGVLVLLLAGESPPAAEPPPDTLLPGPSLPSRGTVVGGLLVVAAALAALPRLLGTVRSGSMRGAGRCIQIEEVRPLGGRRSLVLARVGSRRVLIGSSEAGLQPLLDLEKSVPFSELAPAADPLPDEDEREGGVLLRVEPLGREEARG